MIDPILRDEQPDPIRRAAANLNHAHRFLSSLEDGAPEAMTLSGLVASLDRCVRSVAVANDIEEWRREAQSLVKHAETIQKMRESASQSRGRRTLVPSMDAAHDALLEAADRLKNAKDLANRA